MPEVAEWSFPGGGGLQVYKDIERRPLLVHCRGERCEEQVRRLIAMNVDISNRSSSARVKTVMVRDPEGNSIAFAQVLDPTLAH